MKPRSVLTAPKLEKKDVAAIQAVYAGTASEHQQKLAMEVLIKKICRLSDEPYHENDRDTVFALGKARVARELIALIETPLGSMK